MQSICGSAQFPLGIHGSTSLLRRASTYKLLGVLALAAGMVAAVPARGQSACAQLGVDCSHHDESRPRGDSSSDSTERSNPVEVWKQRWANMKEKQRERKAKQDAENKVKAEAKAKKQQDAEDARMDVIRARERQAEAERQRIAEAERQRKLAEEAERMQAAFNTTKPAAVSGLKGVDGTPAAGLGGDGLGLKGVDDAPHIGGQAAWTATVTDLKVAPMARRLGSVVPPLPISEKEVALDWKKVYLNDDRLMETTDMVVAAWEMTGVLGEKLSGPVGALIIGGKTFIAGEDGAYLHLVTKEKDYDAALAYLKNPAQAKQFARLVQDVRENKPLPAGADPAMARAARAITDPKLGDTGKMVWDAMTSKEAVGAMVRKATIEVGAAVLSPSTGVLLKNEAERKAMFDAVRLERKQAVKMLEEAGTTAVQKEQLMTVIQHADQLSANMYKVDKVTKLASDVADDHISDAMNHDLDVGWGMASDAVGAHFMSKEAKGREY